MALTVAEARAAAIPFPQTQAGARPIWTMGDLGEGGDVDPLRFYVMIAALCQYHVANVYTLSNEFGYDLSKPHGGQSAAPMPRGMLAQYLCKR